MTSINYGKSYTWSEKLIDPLHLLQGLADLMFDEQPSFIVVSNGADCVLINKQFYLQNCSEKLQRKIKADVKNISIFIFKWT